jgi:hypothetical protein
MTDCLINLRLSVTLRWTAEDRQLGMMESVIWQVGTSKVVAPECVD